MMNIKFLRTLIFLLIINFSNSSFAKIKNNIIVFVENEIITNYDLKNKILTTLVLAGEEINQNNIDNLKRPSLEKLVNLAVKRNELKEQNFKDEKKKVNIYLNQISSNNIDALKQKFKTNGIDFNLYFEEVKTELNWQELIYKKFKNKINYDDKAIDDEVNSIILNQSRIDEFNLSEIEIEIENNEGDKAKIQNVINQIREEGFEKTAIKNSISPSVSEKGKIGWINSKSLSKIIFENVKNLNPGDISKPVKMSKSVIFLKVNDKRKIKNNSINKDKIKNEILQRKANEMYSLYSLSYLSKIKNGIRIIYK